ncbi:MAG: vitamin K epoxide reductase family protein, partial [Acidobacteriota bacterium]|nr:vitamin K epoxide reductase family protein [Acidobacteriota bacterium]
RRHNRRFARRSRQQRDEYDRRKRQFGNKINMMSSSEKIFNPFKKFAIAAAVVALVGVADAVYLTHHHYTAEPVPCTIITGCEMVLTSRFATIADIPLALFGAAAYLVAFLLAMLTAFVNRRFWLLFGIQTILMTAFTIWLLYLQGMVIGAFCQFCLLSAAVSFTLFVIALVSRFWRTS